MLYGKRRPKYILNYSDKVFVCGSLAEVRRLQKARKGGKVSKILKNWIIDKSLNKR